ncbi:hypothetical protein OV079_21490 [Nannocystis pusilla]|uniref:Uncharacterized protein n=1 Tax=Nannocystis pusilla TaxID=889268 RepID=A0A9X3IX51_9BACT|nr:hypothetical protein [Nannocystis pusilla]MCY1008082.1 hypothetical protein [Nannocystis pusilla]
MEALLIVVAELMAVPLLVAAALLFELVGAALLGAGYLVLWRSRQRPTRLLRWWRRAVWTLTGVLGLVLTTLVFVDLVLYEPGLRLLLDQVERTSGVDVCFERARGNIFTGHVHLEGVTIRHRNGADLALSIGRLDIDIAMLRLLEREVPITELQLHGVRGGIVRNRALGVGQPGGRGFVIERLVVDDLAIEFEDLAAAPTTRVLPLALEHLEIAPLRSEYALVDVLCHTRARGRARGNAFLAEPGSWTVRDVPLAPQGAVGLGAVGRWLRDGSLDIGVTCVEPDGDPLRLRVDLDLAGFRVSPPAGDRRTAIQRIAAAFSHLGARLQLQFELELERSRLRGVATAAQVGLWDLGVHEYNLQLGRKLGLDEGDMNLLGLGSRALDAAHQRLHARQR